MIIDLIDKLISRAIDLLREEQRSKKSIYDNFVKPLTDQFDELHNDYIRTFIKYREVIIQGDARLHDKHPLFDLIKNDSLSSDSMRVKLGALYCVIKEEKGGSSEFKILLRGIALYLKYSVEAPEPVNSPRDLLAALKGESKEQAVFIIEEKIKELQREYADFRYGYERLKITLIK